MNVTDENIIEKIAFTLGQHFESICYVDIDSGSYYEFMTKEEYKKALIPSSGNNFYDECRKNVSAYVHPDDVEKVGSLFTPEKTRERLSGTDMYQISYRIIAGKKTFSARYIEFMMDDGKHFISCVKNIEKELQAQNDLQESIRKSTVYGRIAESLAAKYNEIYYVNSVSGEYYKISDGSFRSDVEIKKEENDFFVESRKNAEMLIHPDDRFNLIQMLSREYMTSVLETKRQHSVDYRLMKDGEPHFTRLTVMWASDRVHFIVGVENIDDEVNREKERLKALDIAKEMAHRDDLTGTKNKNAYHEFERKLQKEINSDPEHMAFAIVICDINDLKLINDTKGHQTGDEYIRSSCSIICDIFAHSPVFRVGGDEFVACLSGRDYSEKNSLFDKLRNRIRENLGNNDGPIVASGIAVFDPDKDRTVADVFERADRLMYEDKRHLKEDPDSYGMNAIQPGAIRIPEEEKRKLDGLFNAFSLISEGSYVYLCDMKYDYSRWSKRCVDAFGLPSEYMYGAGGIWEEHIHPDDKESYHNGIAAVFSGRTSGHDMQYRAKRTDGKYDVCTCRGIVLKNASGEPAYFGGVIRNHGEQGHIDQLTGLVNHYGFFEELKSGISKNARMIVVMIGISKFSDINEMYGYHFGNSVIQKFGRYLFEFIGNFGSVYRLDGAKFAIICYDLSRANVYRYYDKIRTNMRSGFMVEGRSLTLDLNCGMICGDHFTVDHQTIYSCLNFTYIESKQRRQGDLVEFHNELSEENKYRIEKTNMIRASVMKGFKGFYLLYQPVVDAKTERVSGAEALIRWKNDEYGVVPPDHFIPILEMDPLFWELGQWILRTALRAGLVLRKKYPDLVISVNIAYSQIERPGFMDMVLDILDETGYPHDGLCLEITERCRLLDMNLLRSVTEKLCLHGIRIALDDFGTGFSSIGLLRSLHFDLVKIDRSFVTGIDTDERERNIIKAVSKVTSSYGAQICAEGVETRDERDVLRNTGIHTFQGYLYSRPISLEDFLDLDLK